MTTFKHAAWSATFLSITAAAVGMEIVAATTKDKDLAPWCHYLVKLPKPVTFTAVGVLSTWLPWHMSRAYRKAGK